jgi:two-component system, response regulator YesN
MYDIVIVDDEQSAIRSLRAIIALCDADYRVVGEAESGDRALGVIDELEPEVVITDIRMPGIDGLGLIERVRELDRHIEFIVMSGYDDFDYARMALRLGVVDYLLKPIVPDEVRAALGKIAKRLREREGAAGFGGVEFRSPVREAVDYLEREFSDAALSMQRVADHVGLSVSHFSRCFRDELGTNYRTFLDSLRMRRAVELLADPSLRIGEIADRCGYGGYVPFSKAFKRFYGCSPTGYRRSRRSR